MSTLGIGGANVISPLQPLGESEKVSVDGLKAQYAAYLAGLSPKISQIWTMSLRSVRTGAQSIPKLLIIN